MRSGLHRFRGTPQASPPAYCHHLGPWQRGEDKPELKRQPRGANEKQMPGSAVSHNKSRPIWAAPPGQRGASALRHRETKVVIIAGGVTTTYPSIGTTRPADWGHSLGWHCHRTPCVGGWGFGPALLPRHSHYKSFEQWLVFLCLFIDKVLAESLKDGVGPAKTSLGWIDPFDRRL